MAMSSGGQRLLHMRPTDRGLVLQVVIVRPYRTTWGRVQIAAQVRKSQTLQASLLLSTVCNSIPTLAGLQRVHCLQFHSNTCRLQAQLTRQRNIVLVVLAVLVLLSTFYFLLSTFYFPLSTIYVLLSTFDFLLSTFYFLLSASSTRARHAWHGPSKLFCRLNCWASGRGAALPSTGQPLGANELQPAAHPACAPAHGRGSICTPHSQAPYGQKRKQSVVDKAFGQLHACAFVKPS